MYNSGKKRLKIAIYFKKVKENKNHWKKTYF